MTDPSSSTPPPGATGPGPGEARIVDRGYRSYTGPRTGVAGSVRTVFRHSFERGLGLRRSAWAKVLPIAGILIAYLPGVVFVGMLALIKDFRTGAEELILPSYGDYYGYVIAAIMVFVSLVAPEILCTDRRSGMLGLYLASPLDRGSYFLAKALTVAAILALVCLGPPLLMLLANVLQSQGPETFSDTMSTLWNILLSGGAVTLLYTGVTMGAASLTDRKSFATAGIILLFLVGTMVVGMIEVATAGPTGENPDVRPLAITMLSLEIPLRVHGEWSQIMPGVSSTAVWGSWAAWTFGGFALARYQLHRLPVTR